MVQYSQTQDRTKLADYLDQHPILLELVGEKFFNSFEFLRFVHGGGTLDASANFLNPKIGFAVTSAAIGMGIFINQLETTVLRPLMAAHVHARYILQAAQLVDNFAPSMVDEVAESGWWIDHVQSNITPSPSEDIPQTAQEELQDVDMPSSADLELTLGLSPQADQADITLTLQSPIEGWPIAVDDLGFPHDLSLSPPVGKLLSSPPPDTQSAAPGDRSVFAKIDFDELSEWRDCAVLDMPTGTQTRWDRVMNELPPWIACPSAPSIKVLHHLQGSEIALRPGALDEKNALQHIRFATDTLPTLMDGLFAVQKDMREQMSQLAHWAIGQKDSVDFVVNVLAPTLVRLKVQ
jgi:hypothetical protein